MTSKSSKQTADDHNFWGVYGVLTGLSGRHTLTPEGWMEIAEKLDPGQLDALLKGAEMGQRIRQEREG